MPDDAVSGRLRVLIAGGGVAGPSLAYWLARAGHQVTVAERFPALRAAGAQVDLRGQGIDAVQRMGLLEQVRRRLVAEPGVALVDAHGRTRATVLANTSGRGRQSLTSEYEIMRGDLVRILFDATKDDVDYRFGVSVEGFEQDPRDARRVTASFSEGSNRDYDLLVAADGQGSRVRHALLPSGAPDPYRRLGIHMAYWSVPRTASDVDLRDTYLAPRGRMIWRRSHNPTDTQVYFVLRETSDEATAVHRQPLGRQKRFWADRFADAGWQTPRFVDGMCATENFYSQEVVQVRTPTWSQGRVVLLGDAAHCASPFSGMGVSSALVGARVLAGEIDRDPGNLPAALTSYRTTIAPFVESVQAAVKPRLLRLGMPTTQRAINTLQSVAATATALHVPDVVNRFAKQDRGGAWELPTYP